MNAEGNKCPMPKTCTYTIAIEIQFIQIHTWKKLQALEA
jgi:hypothetical protein